MKKYALLPLLSFVLMSAQIDYRKIDITSEDKLFTAQYLYTFESMPPVDVFQVKNNKTQEIRNIEISCCHGRFYDARLTELKFSPNNQFLIATYERFLKGRNGSLVDYDIYDIGSDHKLFSGITNYKISKGDQFFAISSSGVDIYRYSINNTVKKIKTYENVIEYDFVTIEDSTYFWVKMFMPKGCCGCIRPYNGVSEEEKYQESEELIDLSQFE